MGEGKRLEIGMSVLIKRSDGSLNRAYIAGVNETRKSVMVQWEENGDFKGKEISFHDVYMYNVDLKGDSTEKVEKPWSVSAPVPKHSKSNIDIKLKKSKTDSRLSFRGSSRGSLNPIKEVERLKKIRDERRVSMARKKEEKEIHMKAHQKNPNWEFSVMIEDFRKNLSTDRISESGPGDTHQITVCVRKRPLNSNEIKINEVDVISVVDQDTLIVHEPKTKVDLTKYLDNQYYKFDYVFDESCSNDLVYKYTAKPLVRTIFLGGVSTCFAYGQTGSGKTFTMGGNVTQKSGDYLNGIYAKTAFDVFHYLSSPSFTDMGLKVMASYFEIYREKLFDLLAGKAPLRVFEDTKQHVNVIGLTEREVRNVDEVLLLIKEGNTARTSGKTLVNESSSRSHAVFQIALKKGNKIHGKFCLIDLAGNERGGQTLTHRAKMEGADINKSLLALKECIRALGRKDGYLPFRGSKLTQVLRDAFIGDKAKTCMIAMLSPGLTSCKNTLNTLRYANRVKELECNEADFDDTSSIHKTYDSPVVEPMEADSQNTPQKIITIYDKREQQLNDEFAKYFNVSQVWNKKERELMDNSNQKFQLKHFVSSLNEILSERLTHIKHLLGLTQEVSRELDLETIN